MAYIKVDHYVLDVLMRDLAGHDKKPAAFVVYLYLWYRTLGSDLRTVRISHQQVANATGLSKSTVQHSVRWLARRHLVRVHRENKTSVPQYTLSRPWRRA
jgi:DNA-binding GntR family transcriptional regulator